MKNFEMATTATILATGMEQFNQFRISMSPQYLPSRLGLIRFTIQEQIPLKDLQDDHHVPFLDIVTE